MKISVYHGFYITGKMKILFLKLLQTAMNMYTGLETAIIYKKNVNFIFRKKTNYSRRSNKNATPYNPIDSRIRLHFKIIQHRHLGSF